MTWLEEYMMQLTERERQVVLMLGKGLAAKQIAKHLGTRPDTVRRQLRQAQDKAGCQTVVELAVKVATSQQ